MTDVVMFAAIADGSNDADVSTAMAALHDRLIAGLGERFVGPVRWEVLSAERGLLRLADMDYDPPVVDLRPHLVENIATGALVIASAKARPA